MRRLGSSRALVNWIVIVCLFVLPVLRRRRLCFHSVWLCQLGRCVGDTTAVARLGIPSFCFEDGPAGMRLTKNVTGFPAGINAASTFSRRLMRARGKAMAEEFRGKGAQWVPRFQLVWERSTQVIGSVLLGPALDIVSLTVPWRLSYAVWCKCSPLLDAQSQSRTWVGKARWTPLLINPLVTSNVYPSALVQIHI